ncbi:MAG: hypothetical protein Q8N01_02815 [Sulfuricurvum sp.]|jgi:hypothetical protein|nr:hypothetical protein [Sulfuricurvum sp.]
MVALFVAPKAMKRRKIGFWYFQTPISGISSRNLSISKNTEFVK